MQPLFTLKNNNTSGFRGNVVLWKTAQLHISHKTNTCKEMKNGLSQRTGDVCEVLKCTAHRFDDSAKCTQQVLLLVSTRKYLCTMLVGYLQASVTLTWKVQAPPRFHVVQFWRQWPYSTACHMTWMAKWHSDQ